MDRAGTTRRALRIAAIGDIHVARTSQGLFHSLFTQISSTADVLLLCGDFTDYGLPDEARILARGLTSTVKMPVIAVLGNHDYESGRQGEIRQILSDAGVTVLDGEATEVHGVGFAGAKGFAGGFGRGALGPWGEEVDDEWFAHAVEKEILGVSVKLCPAEEMIWSKALIMERERYDGADVAHLLRHCSGLLNWDRLIRRFGPHWRVLLSHLVLFGFIYPGERALIPAAAIKELVARLLAELDVPTRDSKVCQGTLLSRAQFLVDLEEWGYEDGRLQPRGRMTAEQIAEWIAAIDRSSH